jgi:long-chain fatty acid transport protein
MKTELNQTTRYWRAKRAGLPLCLLGLITGIALPEKSGAVGYLFPNQDPEAIARGNAFTATADNASAIYYNPAGITQLPGGNIRVGLYAISLGESYRSPSGGTARADSNVQEVPQLYATYSVTNTPLTFGLGVYAPYGLSINWGNNAPFNTLGESGKLLYVSINPVVAARVTKTLSVAFGPTVNYSDATLRQAITGPADQFSMKGTGIALGFTAGVLWQPHPMVSLGIDYRSPTAITYSGTSHFDPYFPSTSTSATINFPQNVVAGISFRPTPNWNFEADVNWTDWDTVKQIVFNGTAIGNVALTLDYQSSFIYEFGVTRQLGKGYYASVGYMYSENSSPSQNFSPIIPDSNLQLGGIGFGHHGKNWDWDIAYQFAFNGGNTISNDSNPAADGTYRVFNNAINIATTYKF